MGLVRILPREVWKYIGPDGRSTLLQEMAHKKGGTGKVEIRCESVMRWLLRKVPKWTP